MARDPRCIVEERKLATVRLVKDILPIEKADKIELAIIDGWQCVVKKGEFKAGDKVIYIEIDSIVPDIPEFEFLRDKNFRVKTIKLRGQLSQGLAIPLDILKGKSYKVGADVTKELGILKYDLQKLLELRTDVVLIPPKTRLGKWLMRFKWYEKLRIKAYRRSIVPFPNWIAKTDEERVQNILGKYDEAVASGKTFYVTEKLDGQSFTAYIKEPNKTYICSRNLGVSINGNTSYARVYKSHNIDEIMTKILADGDNEAVVLQGEICGPGIQHNLYKFTEDTLFVFNIIIKKRDVKAPTRLNYDQMVAITNQYGLKSVPLLDDNYKLPADVNDVLKYSDAPSVVYPKQTREGVVIRDKDYKFSFKVVSSKFLLEEKD